MHVVNYAIGQLIIVLVALIPCLWSWRDSYRVLSLPCPRLLNYIQCYVSWRLVSLPASIIQRSIAISSLSSQSPWYAAQSHCPWIVRNEMARKLDQLDMRDGLIPGPRLHAPESLKPEHACNIRIQSGICWLCGWFCTDRVVWNLLGGEAPKHMWIRHVCTCAYADTYRNVVIISFDGVVTILFFL